MFERARSRRVLLQSNIRSLNSNASQGVVEWYLIEVFKYRDRSSEICDLWHLRLFHCIADNEESYFVTF